MEATLTRRGVPDRSLEQRRRALVEANRIRSARAVAKVELKHGRRRLADVLEDPDMATAKIVDLLVAVPKVGRVKAHRWLTRARISPSRTVGGLTVRQRAEVLALVFGR